MSVSQVETITEIHGAATVVAIKSDTSIERDGQLVGFYVRGRREGDRFEIAKWEDFSPRWMRFADVPPDGWVAKIEAREKLRGQIDSLSLTEIPAEGRSEADTLAAYSQNPTVRTANDFDYGTGKMRGRNQRETLSVKKG